MVQRLGGTDIYFDTSKPNTIINIEVEKFGIAGQKINNSKVEDIQVEVPNKYFYDEPFGDHSNMDSKDVWNKINEIK